MRIMFKRNENKDVSDSIAGEKPAIDYTAMRYRGANPDYIVYKELGESLSFEEYQENVLPIINLSFPEVNPGLKHRHQEKLDKNEALYIEKRLQKKGYKVLIIPKVLYDLFYVYFRYKELVEHHGPYLKGLDPCDHSKENHKKLRAIAKHVSPTEYWLKTGGDTITMDIYQGIKFIKPDQFSEYLKNEKISMQAPILQVAFDKIFQDYQDRENDIFYLKSEFVLNKKILAYFQRMRIKQPFNVIDLKRIAEDISNKLYKVRDLFSDTYFGAEIDLLDKTFLYPSNKINFEKIILKTLLHEFALDPAYYTLYRTKESRSNSFSGSLSFGQSVFSGIEYDSKSGSPLTIKLQHPERHLYYFDVKKSDFHNPHSICSNLFLIPPARRINRTIATGEVWHARTKIPFNQTISGFSSLYVNYSKLIGKFFDKPHPLKIDTSIIRNEQDYKKIVSPFIEKNLLVLPSIKRYSIFSKKEKPVVPTSIADNKHLTAKRKRGLNDKNNEHGEQIQHKKIKLT